MRSGLSQHNACRWCRIEIVGNDDTNELDVDTLFWVLLADKGVRPIEDGLYAVFKLNPGDLGRLRLRRRRDCRSKKSATDYE